MMLKWVVEFYVHDTWVSDGFELDDERALDMLSNDLAYAIPGVELEAKVIKKPNPKVIAKLQGFSNGND